MGPNWNRGYRAIRASKDRGCRDAGRDVGDRRLKLGRAVLVEDSAEDREWDVTGKAGLIVPSVRRLVSAEATGRIVVFRAEM